MNDRHEKGGANDGPQNWERAPIDCDGERLWELEHPSNPRPKKCTDETKSSRNDKPTANTTCDGLSDCAAHRCDQDEDDQSR